MKNTNTASTATIVTAVSAEDKICGKILEKVHSIRSEGKAVDFEEIENGKIHLVEIEGNIVELKRTQAPGKKVGTYSITVVIGEDRISGFTNKWYGKIWGAINSEASVSKVSKMSEDSAAACLKAFSL